jgi:hypothetical protein
MHLRPRHIRGWYLFQHGPHELAAVAVQIGLDGDQRIFGPVYDLWQLAADNLNQGPRSRRLGAGLSLVARRGAPIEFRPREPLSRINDGANRLERVQCGFPLTPPSKGH